MSPKWIIARLTFREATRRRIVLTALVLGLGFLIIYSIGFHLINNQISSVNRDAVSQVSRNEGFNFLFLAGLYAVAFLSVAMGALLGVDTLAGEISSGTVQTVVTKPIQRGDVVVGKWLGYAGLLGLYLIMMAGGIIASVWLQSRYTAQHMLQGVALIYFESLIIMTIALLCSSRLSALAAGGVVFGLYGLSFIGGWVEQLGSILHSSTAVDVGIITSLIIPSEAMWRRAAYEMQSPLSGLLNMSPFGTSSVPSALMIVYAGVYVVAALILTMRIFTRRDL
jgi:Cu-processing system permease protein